MKEFIKAAALRALRTFCQTFGSTIGTAAVMGEVNWIACLSASTLAAILSILTSIATGLPEAPVNKTVPYDDAEIDELTK